MGSHFCSRLQQGALSFSIFLVNMSKNKYIFQKTNQDKYFEEVNDAISSVCFLFFAKKYMKLFKFRSF